MKTYFYRLFFSTALVASLLLFDVVEVSAKTLRETSKENRAQGNATSNHGRSGRSEVIRNMKIAFFTDVLELTTEQSQQFWPIYNEYWASRREFGQRRKMLFASIREGGTDEKQLNELVGFVHAECELMEDCMAKLRKVLPDDKVAKVFVAGDDFKNQIIRKAVAGDLGKDISPKASK